MSTAAGTVGCVAAAHNNYNNKPLTWDVTVVSTLAASYLSSSARSAGAAADLAASRNRQNIRASPTRIFFSQSQ